MKRLLCDRCFALLEPSDREEYTAGFLVDHPCVVCGLVGPGTHHVTSERAERAHAALCAEQVR